MIKQTLYFGNPSYLSLKNNQLSIKVKKEGEEISMQRPIEDIGIVILDNPQITISHSVIISLQNNKTVIVSCDQSHMPHSIMLPMEGHTQQSERYRDQVDVSLPLKKYLWQQTIEAKVGNQIAVLEKLGKPTQRLKVLINRVTSGDLGNIEGQAAAIYWPLLFDGFKRDRDGDPPNNLLNYGYAILRAMTARALVSSGMHLTLGIHHRNKYNAYCLADDIMEPYRPFVDLIVYNMFINNKLESFLNKESKMEMLKLPTMDAKFDNRFSPLQVGMSITTASLYKCFAGKKRKIIYPMIV